MYPVNWTIETKKITGFNEKADWIRFHGAAVGTYRNGATTYFWVMEDDGHTVRGFDTEHEARQAAIRLMAGLKKQPKEDAEAALDPML